MTDHNTASLHNPHSNPPEQLTVVAILDTNNPPQSRFGEITCAMTLRADTNLECDAPPSPEITPPIPFCLAMDQLRLHLEAQVRQFGYQGPLDFTWQDFADLFTDVASEEDRPIVLEALTKWYRTIYVRYLHSELIRREQFEHSFVENNYGLVVKIVNRYMSQIHTFNNAYDKREELRSVLLRVGCEGLRKAMERFNPLLGWEFSTYAGPWINGEITGYFKHLETMKRKWLLGAPRTPHVPRVPEDYTELRAALEQAFARLNDSRKEQIVTLHHGLFGKQEHRFREIGGILGVTPQRVQVINRKTLEQLKQDEELRAFYVSWFNRTTSSWWWSKIENREGRILRNGKDNIYQHLEGE